MINPKPLRTFVEALQDIEHSMPGEQFDLSVKYCDDEFVYVAWPMPRGNYITETGLKDPGFGPGPTLFSSIEFVMVHSNPRRGEATRSYEQKFAALRTRVQRIPGVTCDQSGITFRND